MPDLPEVAIEGALLAAAQAFANAQSLTIAMPNRAFKLPAAATTVGVEPNKTTEYGKWLRATVLPADTETLGIGANDDNRHYGYLALDVFHGQGPSISRPARIAAEAISYFARGSKFVRDGITVEILEQPYRLSAIKDDPWLMIPVRIKYCCFTNPA